MGNSRWDSDSWTSYSASVSSAPRAAIFTSNGMDDSLDPKKIKFRESVDSAANPNSTPIMIGVDETGSMGALAEQIIKEGLGIVMKEIYERKPVTDPHCLLAGVGDAAADQSPLQVTQFEAAVEPLTKQIEKIYLEGNGGGNNGESYNLLWYFAAHKTKCDAISKRKRKGYLFTVGDERVLPSLTKSQIQRIFGDDVESDIKTKDLLNQVKKHWEVFHIIVETSATRDQGAIENWREILGERAIVIPNKDSLAEIIVSTIQVNEGADADKVADSWDGSTAVVVRDALKNLSKSSSGSSDLVRM
jgi:hypothetical protein